MKGRTVLALWIGLLALAWIPSGADADVYRYVDENGIPHFTDSADLVPPRYRDQVGEISKQLEERRINILPGLDRVPGTEPSARPATPPPASRMPTPSFGLGMLKAVGGMVFLFLLLVVPIALIVSALILQLACKLAAPDVPTLGRACLVLLAQWGATLVVGVAFGVGIALLVGLDALQGTGVNLLSSAVSLGVAAAILSRMLEMSFPRGLGVTLLHILLSIVICLVPALLFALATGGLRVAS